MIRSKKRWFHPLMALVVLSFGLLACNLTRQINQPSPGTTAPTTGAPVVLVNSPANGGEVALGQEVLVQSNAEDSVGVTRIELRVDGFIVNTVASESPVGDRQFSVIQTWKPAQVGPATLEVIAYRASIASQPARIVLNVREDASQISQTAVPPAGVTQVAPDDLTCRARVEVQGLNFRTGPATNYPILNVLTLGNLVEITGRLYDNTWWQVRSNLNYGWVSSAYTSETGDCSAIPIVVPPPSPTPRPATATPTTAPTSSPLPGTIAPPPTATYSIPDLVVTEIRGPSLLQLNATGTVSASYTVTVSNIGTGFSGQFTTSFRRPDGTITQLPIVVNLAPGQSADLVTTVSFSASDRYRLEATVDSGAQVNESDEGNNLRILDVTVTTAPAS